MKIKLILATLVAIMLPFILPAQTLLEGSAKEEFAQKALEASGKLLSLECTFTQTKSSALLSEKLLSKGQMSYTAPDKLRWEYLSPSSLAFIVDGDKAVLLRDGQKTENRRFTQVATVILDAVTGRYLSAEGGFEMKVQTQGGGGYRVELKPLRKSVARLFTLITLVLDAEMSARGVELLENNGDKTEIEFSDVRKNN